jgi:hypothetical protein
MKFADYKTRKDFTARKVHEWQENATILADAPGQGCRWVLTGDRQYAKVRKRGDEYYRILSEEW